MTYFDYLLGITIVLMLAVASLIAICVPGSDDDPHHLDIPDVLRVLPPIDADDQADAWDKEH